MWQKINKVFQNYQKEKKMKIFCPGPKKNSLIIVRLKCFDTYRALNAIMVEIRSKVYVYTKQIIYTSIREKHAQHIYSSGYEDTKGHQSIIFNITNIKIYKTKL